MVLKIDCSQADPTNHIIYLYTHSSYILASLLCAKIHRMTPYTYLVIIVNRCLLMLDPLVADITFIFELLRNVSF